MAKTLNKQILAFKHIVKPNNIRPILANVQITEDKIRGTDSFCILELERKGKETLEDFPVMNGVKLVKKIKKPLLINMDQLVKNVRFPKSTPLDLLEDAVLANQTDKTIDIVTNDLNAVNKTELRLFEGEFPELKNVFWDQEQSVVSTCFDVKLMSRFLNALIDAGYEKATMHTKGDLSMIQFTLDDGSRGGIMPMRREGVEVKKHAEKCTKFPCICDGFHTFDELYEHRITLYIELCRNLLGKKHIWRSKFHSDGTEWAGWFILGINEEQGQQITYHLPIDKWKQTDFATTLKKAPEFDGHTSDEVLERIKKLYISPII